MNIKSTTDAEYSGFGNNSTESLLTEEQDNLSSNTNEEGNTDFSTTFKINKLILTASKDIIYSAINNGHSTDEAVNIAHAKAAYTKRTEKFRKSCRYA